MTELMRAIIYDMLFFARTVTVVRVRGLLTVIVKVFFSFCGEFIFSNDIGEGHMIVLKTGN